MVYSKMIDKKWQKEWEKTKLYSFNRKYIDKKLYCLEMFSYPSGAQLHIGHWYNFGLTDSWARMKRMQGFEVFHPMGFDAFGLPAENYAIKTGIHPQDSTIKNIETMERQLKEMGATYDWDYKLATCSQDYYKWTQWLFLKLYKSDLAYRKEAPVNWCPSCKTVLANEQVLSGQCERCSSEVTKKNLTQWFFKITDYAEELLNKLNNLDWPEKTKKIQKNWIGRSEGGEIEFKVEGKEFSLKVFTTRADTLYGVTYIVIAPESSLVKQLISANYFQEVNEYIEMSKKLSEIDRMSTIREKTGVFTGAYALHPITGERLPVWIADYVVEGYGTGCVMAVPAHDERDYEFAVKYKLPIKRVINCREDTKSSLPNADYGILIDSGEYSGMESEKAKIEIIKKLEPDGKGKLKVNYRLRDWLVSRQRYWGAPIPIIYCEDCGMIPVPEKDLPVLLPYNVEFKPDGESPLRKSKEFMSTKCPVCGKDAKRDTDTLDTFVCSSWYYLRYPDTKNDENPFDTNWINKILPVDKYVGGSEHAAMHLLYARFITKALRDLGYLNFDEPFLSLTHQGTILGPDGTKMSKNKGNVVSPDDYIDQNGSDVFRLYLAFGFDYTEGGPWNDDGIKAISRFLNRVEKMVEMLINMSSNVFYEELNTKEKELDYMRHITIKTVTEDAEKFHFNTAVARLMECLNVIYKYFENEYKNIDLLKNTITDFIKLLAPFAPHFSEEMWQKLGLKYSIFNQEWPCCDINKIKRDLIEIAIQVNGKVKSKITINSGLSKEKIEELAINDTKVRQLIEGKNVVKTIVVPDSIINIVIK